ncbi:unnamed protein product [Victoria cruziana]
MDPKEIQKQDTEFLSSDTIICKTSTEHIDLKQNSLPTTKKWSFYCYSLLIFGGTSSSLLDTVELSAIPWRMTPTMMMMAMTNPRSSSINFLLMPTRKAVYVQNKFSLWLLVSC